MVPGNAAQNTATAFPAARSCDVPLVDRLTDEQSKEANKSETERECDKMVLPRGHE